MFVWLLGARGLVAAAWLLCRSDGVYALLMHVLSLGHSDARVGRSPENMFVGKRTRGVSTLGLRVDCMPLCLESQVIASVLQDAS